MEKLIKKRKVRKPGRRRQKNPRREMTFLEHLEELRGRLIICISAIIVTTIVFGGLFGRTGVNLLTRPFMTGTEKIEKKKDFLEIQVEPDGVMRVRNIDALTTGAIANRSIFKIYPPGKDSEGFLWGLSGRESIIATRPFAPFLAWLKVALIIGISLAMPIWLHQIWLFVAPAMTAAERKVIRPVLVAGVFLFPLGVAFAYGMLYFVMRFLLAYAERFSGIRLLPDIEKYISFAMTFMLTFGLVFEMPLAILMMVRMGVVETATLRKSRPYAVVIICVLSAVLTPQDPFSMAAMALPMLILYEGSLWISVILERRIRAAEKREAARQKTEDQS